MKRVIGSINVPTWGGLTRAQPRYKEVPDDPSAQQREGGARNDVQEMPKRRRIMERPEGIPPKRKG